MIRTGSDKLYNNKKRIENLDLQRAIAILLVIFYHIPQLLLPNLFNRYSNLFEVGSFGVDMFFILSGFLISGLYYGSKDFNKQNMFLFWIKRFLRTYPPYLIMILFFFFITSTIKHNQHFEIGYLFFTTIQH